MQTVGRGTVVSYLKEKGEKNRKTAKIKQKNTNRRVPVTRHSKQHIEFDLTFVQLRRQDKEAKRQDGQNVMPAGR